MTAGDEQRRHRRGSWLVALQLTLIAVLGVLGGPPFMQGRAPLSALVLAAIGLAIGGWTLAVNRPGNFNVHPAPRAGGRLVREGPYRWIRHPMYTCVMICAVAAAWAARSPWGWLAAGALAGVLQAKATLEERWMAQAHAGYDGYRASTWRFVPWLW
jgi:protein-S-isoprenylcysteine O-methyltransferase Ste14